MNKIPDPIRLIELHPFVSSTSMIWPAYIDAVNCLFSNIVTTN